MKNKNAVKETVKIGETEIVNIHKDKMPVINIT